MYFCLFVIAMTMLTACGEASPATDDRSSVDGDSADGEYDDGQAHCCAKGQGTSCCKDQESGTCFEYGGLYGECITEGNELEAKVVCAKCCEGLRQLSQLDVVGNDVPPEIDGLAEGCDRDISENVPPPSLLICLPCGNGVCDEKEHACNCPEDCKFEASGIGPSPAVGRTDPI